MMMMIVIMMMMMMIITMMMKMCFPKTFFVGIYSMYIFKFSVCFAHYIYIFFLSFSWLYHNNRGCCRRVISHPVICGAATDHHDREGQKSKEKNMNQNYINVAVIAPLPPL